MLPANTRSGIPQILCGEIPLHLNETEMNRLTEAYQKWADTKPSSARARHWAVFLLLRSGARVSEVLALDDMRDLDFRRAEAVLPTLKRRRPSRRTVPLPPNVLAELGCLLAAFPALKGRLFKLNRSTVYRVFRKRCQEAGIPKALAHPHVLRHTRAIELLRAGVPVTAVQQLLACRHLYHRSLFEVFGR